MYELLQCHKHFYVYILRHPCLLFIYPWINHIFLSFSQSSCAMLCVEVCLVISRLFSGSWEWQQQSYSGHSPSVFACHRCPRTYQHKRSLVLHLRFECGQEPKFPCPQCPQRFKHKAHLKRHLANVHGVA